MGAGGAATSLPVLQFFEDIGIPVIEGYGLTETAPIITAGSVDFSNRRLGCVGVPLPGQDVRIIDPNTNEVLGNDTDGEVRAMTSFIYGLLISRPPFFFLLSSDD